MDDEYLDEDHRPPASSAALEVDLRDPAVVLSEDYPPPWGAEDEDLTVFVLQQRIASLTTQLELAHALVRRRRQVARVTRLALLNERSRMIQDGVEGRNSEQREGKVEYRTHPARTMSEQAADALRDATEYRDLLDKQITSYQTLLNAAIRAEEIAHAVDRFA